MSIDKTDWVTVAILVPVATLAAVAAAKRIGAWLEHALTRTFAETVRDVVAPDLARLGSRLSQSVDELRQQNHREHAITSVRLQDVDQGLTELGERLTVLEERLARPSDARTRATDHQEGNQA